MKPCISTTRSIAAAAATRATICACHTCGRHAAHSQQRPMAEGHTKREPGQR